MKVLLRDVDSKIPNLPLMKISAWHKLQGDEVGFCIENPDKVYISCIFTKNAEQARGIPKLYPGAEIDIGGSGINLSKQLPKEIEDLKPDYDLYPSTYSQGYTTRGCIRDCPFCIVRLKEGFIRIAQHPSEFHDSRFNTCMIMDNNLFAAPQDWQDGVLGWFIENKIKMLSPQGWDARLLTKDRAETLKKIRHIGPVHFAWDQMKDEEAVMRAIGLLRNAGFNLHHKVTFYVLVGFNTTFEEDLYRCNKLRDLDVQPYVMRFSKNPQLNALARWVNAPQAFWSFPFSEYTRKGKRPKKQVVK